MSTTPDVAPVACMNKSSLARFSKSTGTKALIYSVASHEPSDAYLYAQYTIDALQARIDELETQLFIERAEPALSLFETLGLAALPAFPSVRPNQIESKS